MNIDKFNNCIIILKDKTKESFLKKINKLINVKIITLNELKRKCFFDYDEETICYICDKYNVIYDVAKIYLENLYYVSDKDKSSKMKFLKDLKDDLDSKHLLYYNDMFMSYLNSNKVILYNLKYVNKFYKNIFDSLNDVTYVETEVNESKKDLYCFDSVEEEVSFVADKICELIKNGIDINNIKLCNVKDNYIYTIKKIFKLYNIPVTLNLSYSAKGSILVSKFKENYCNDISKTFESISELIKTNEDKKIYNKILNVINKYCFVNDYDSVKSIIFNELDQIKINNEVLDNSVKCIDIEEEIDDSDYVFLINYNEGVIPVNSKDEDYLPDSVKSLIGVSTSYEMNKNNISLIQDKILSSNNMIVTYSKYINGSEAYISPSYSEEIFNKCVCDKKYDNSNNYNKILLLKDMDEYKKYSTISDRLKLLKSNYSLKYMCFDNKFKGVNTKLLSEYLGHKLTLSYTSMDTYYKCGFRYYLDYILKINKYQDTFEIVIGNIFHKILSECFFDENYNIDECYDREVKSVDYEFNNCEKFYLNILKDEIKLIVETIKEQLKYTSLSKIMCEKEIIVDVNKELNVKFKGFVDKILYDECNGHTVVAIIDYKTGNPNLEINNSIYGLHMQLPVYIYLIKNEISNVKVAGFYLQKILNNKSSLEERKNDLKLQGYSNSDTSILSMFDSSYEDSKIVKSLKVTNSGGFYSYSKVISDEEIDILSDIVKSKINEASDNILNGKFDINPKEIDNKNIGCDFCKYKDVCYMTNSDIVTLRKCDNVFEEVSGNASMD